MGSSYSNYLNTGKTLEELGISFGSGVSEQTLTINGVKIGTYTTDTSLSDILNAFNKNSDVGVTVSFSQITGSFTFKSKETGSAGSITFGNDLAATLFGSGTLTAGQDALVTATVNGKTVNFAPSINTLSIDGLELTLQGTFTDEDNPITFSTKTNSESIATTIKSFVEDYNAILKSIHDAYATQPLEKNSSKHTRYEPLTDEDKEDMSESAIEKYEEKAKTGLLFNDTDLYSLYNKLRSYITENNALFKAAGLSTSYSDGLTQITVDEDKLISALDSDVDTVKSLFIRQDSKGSDVGLASKVKNILSSYASTSIASPGILVKKAGTTKSATSLLSNTLQTRLTSLTEQIESWQEKMSDKIDYYTNQFTAMEKLISNMNNQSSMLMGLTGY